MSTIFWKKIKQFKPDIVLAHEYGINTIAAILAKPFFNYKLYLTCDDNVQMAAEYTWSRSMLRRFVVAHVDGFVCVSPQTVDYLHRKYEGKDCRFGYFPIIQNDKILAHSISLASSKALEYESMYNLADKKVLLFVGRLEPVKCVDMAIDAFKAVCKDDYRFVIVGRGQQEAKLKKQVENYGMSNHVLFTGPLSGTDLYGWYYLSKLFILPSNHESFGAVVNEALVGGCRVIASDHCGSAALVNNSNGVVFESGNQKQLEATLEKEMAQLPSTKSHESKMPKTFSAYYNDLLSLIDPKRD